MKTFVHVLLVAACLVACARGLPRGIGGFDSSEEDDTNIGFGFGLSDYFSDYINSIRQRLHNMFLNPLDFKIPEGANTTSTTKVINGHVVTVNETTYSSGDELGGTAFRIRIIDIKPQNETVDVDSVGGNAQPTARPEVAGSAETVEDFNNEISKNVDTLTA
ncbi:PREDICTED: icarapin-like [Vollenhovia emeryi]|uniref:icarapin-like n=1 Tax=Vollenhovia emeryi TaxID=411798 RepID=UPI0005F50513|nr:PREDICTED: icarapin-like [Vollenhovia emeryi]